MAKNTVEYYSASLGSGVIANAASEATLRELLLAFNGMSGGNNADLINDTDSNIKATNKVLSAAGKAFSSLAAGLVNTVTAGKNFTAMLARGEDKLSAYSKFLEQDVLKKLPYVGDALGGFASIITTGIAVLESYNDDLKQATKYGSTFGNDMLEFKETALRMGLGTDELISLISENSEKMVAFGGGTVTSGLRNFSKMSQAMFMENTAVSDVLDRLGYSSQQQNELLLDYNFSSRRGKAFQQNEYDTTSRGFLAYASQLDVFTKLTGQSRVDRLKAAAAANQDITYQLSVGKLGDDEQVRMETALQGFSMMFGAEGAELFKARQLNVTTMNDTALALSIAVGPEFDKAIGEIQRLAKVKNIDTNVFNNTVNKLMGDQLANAKDAVKKLEPLLTSAVSGNERAKQTVKALTPVMEYLVRQGELSADVRSQYVKQIEAIKKEQQDADAFTDVLRKFQRSVMRVYHSFLKNLFPVFKELADEFKISMVPEMINSFGKQLQQLANDALPHLKNFMSNITSPEGIALMGSVFSDMFDGMKYYLRGMIVETFQGKVLPDWAASSLRRFGIISDPGRLKGAGTELINRSKNRATQLFNKDMNTDGVDLSMKSVTVDGKTHFIADLMRGADGFYRSSTDIGTAVTGMDQVRNSKIIEAIALEREKKATALGNTDFAGKPEEFGGLSLLQREAVITHATREVLGLRNTNEDLAAILSDPSKYAEARVYDKNRINNILKDADVQRNIQKNRAMYPNTYLGMNTGTLGTFGSLFANFGKGTRATLHGKEAIVTPAQLQKVVGAGTQISVRDVVNRLNNNISLMISVAKEDVRLERSKLMAMT